jgi:signal peptidase I
MTTSVAPSIMTVEYSGETARRHRWVAAGLTLISPGLGYMYAGHLLKGITANLLFVLVFEAFVIALSVWKFFPLMPAVVLVAGWAVFSALAALHVWELLPQDRSAYVLRPYNHWVIYGIVLMLTYLTPILVTTHFTARHLWSVNTLHTAAMYPGLEPGDTVLIDKMIYKRSPPQRGDLVAVAVPQSDELLILRVVAVPEDEIRMEGYSVYLNEAPVQLSPLKSEYVQYPPGANEVDLYPWIEHNEDRSYVIALSPRVFAETEIPATRIASNEYFLLADNRSQLPLTPDQGYIRDSRMLGPIGRAQIVGRPTHIAWSHDPIQAQTRWERIGLRLE